VIFTSWLSQVLMVRYQMTCIVVLINILIAQMSDTYQCIKIEAQKALELNRAAIVTRVELNSIFASKVWSTLHSKQSSHSVHNRVSGKVVTSSSKMSAKSWRNGRLIAPK
jgi:hypothetical protein